MAMDTVTGYWSDERPAWDSRRRATVARREAVPPEIPNDSPAGGTTADRPSGSATARPVARRAPAVCSGSHAPDLHGSRLTPRGRLVVALVWLVMAAVAALMLATVPGESAQAPARTTKVVVEPGQTLWEIAGGVESGADRHETAAAIMSLNDLESAAQIRPGDILLVPVEP